MGLYEATWSTALRKTITSTAAAIAAVLGVITAAPTALEAWDGAGLPTFATRGWTRVQLVEYKALRLDIANGKKESAEGRLDQLELDYLKAQTEAEKVQNLQAQRRQKDTIDRIKEQIKAIEQVK